MGFGFRVPRISGPHQEEAAKPDCKLGLENLFFSRELTAGEPAKGSSGARSLERVLLERFTAAICPTQATSQLHQIRRFLDER